MMLSYGYWQRRFGGDPSVVGRTLTVDGLPKKVVGVMPAGFRIVNADADLIFPLAFDVSRFTLGGFNYQGVARLRPGVTIAQANADLARLIPIWMQSWSDGPGTSPRSYESWNIAPALRPLKDDVIGGVTDVLWVVMATIGLVMLIACANVTNLLLVRGGGAPEGAVGACGARREPRADRREPPGRKRAARSARRRARARARLRRRARAAGDRAAESATPQRNRGRCANVGVRGRLSLLSSVLFGLIPAVKYTAPRIAAALGSLGRTTSVSRERHRVRSAMVVVQVAIALVLLVSAGLMIRTFQSIRTVDPGFTQPEHLQILRIFVSSVAPTAEQSDAHRERHSGQAGVDTGCDLGGVRERDADGGVRPEPGRRELRRHPRAGPDRPTVRQPARSPVQIRVARVLSHRRHQADCRAARSRGPKSTTSDPSAVVSENLARELWGTDRRTGEAAIRHLPEMPWHEVIGVVQDVRENGVYEPAPPTVYWPTMSASLNARPGQPNAIRGVTFIVRSDRPGTEGF